MGPIRCIRGTSVPAEEHGHEVAVHLGQLDELPAGEELAQLADMPPRTAALTSAGQAQGLATDRVFEAAAFLSQAGHGGVAGIRGIQAPGDQPERGEIARQRGPVVEAHRWRGQRRGSPALAPPQDGCTVSAAQGLADRKPRQLSALRGRLRAQLGCSERGQLCVDRVEPSPAGGEKIAGSTLRLGEDRPGEPRRGAGPEVGPPGRGRREKQPLATSTMPGREGRAAREQPRAGGQPDVGPRRGRGEPSRGPDDGRRRALDREAALEQDDRGVGGPQRPPLTPEQGQRLPAALDSAGRVTRGRGGQRRTEQQLGSPGSRDTLPLATGHRVVGHMHRIAVESGGEEDLHPRHGDPRLDDPELLEDLLGLVEQGEGRWQVAAGEGDESPFSRSAASSRR